MFTNQPSNYFFAKFFRIIYSMPQAVTPSVTPGGGGVNWSLNTHICDKSWQWITLRKRMRNLLIYSWWWVNWNYFSNYFRLYIYVYLFINGFILAKCKLLSWKNKNNTFFGSFWGYFPSFFAEKRWEIFWFVILFSWCWLFWLDQKERCLR